MSKVTKLFLCTVVLSLAIALLLSFHIDHRETELYIPDVNAKYQILWYSKASMCTSIVCTGVIVFCIEKNAIRAREDAKKSSDEQSEHKDAEDI